MPDQHIGSEQGLAIFLEAGPSIVDECPSHQAAVLESAGHPPRKTLDLFTTSTRKGGR